MMSNKNKDENNKEALTPQVGLTKQTCILIEYIHQDNGKNILTKIEEPRNVCDKINASINMAYENKPNWA